MRVAPAHPSPLRSTEAVLSTTKLLLVDDDEFVRGALTRALNQTGAFDVVPAENGHHALELLTRESVDAVLTDLQMPAMDGLALLGHLFERGIRVPVAVMTGQDIAPDLSRRLHEYGIAATFTKPVNVGTLADELQRALDPETVGRIKGITLFGLIQLLEVERKSALIVVRAAGSEGRLFLENGALVHAHVRRLAGLEAAYEILGWHDPAVEIFYRRRARQRTITTPLHHVLMEAARLIDEGGQTPEHAPRAAGAAGAGTEAVLPREQLAAKPPRSRNGSSVGTALREACEIAGAIGAAVVDASSGLTLGDAGGSDSFSMELAAAVATDVVRAERKGMAALHLDDAIQDIMITLGRQYHLISFTGADHDVFVYLVLDREHANLGMARHTLSGIMRRLRV